jgi:methylase of polypeptide subunit release factors
VADDVIERLGELLREAGFGGARHAALVHTPGGVPPSEALETAGRADDARLAVLLRLFGQGQPLPRGAAERAIAPLGLEDLVELGLVEGEGSRVRGLVSFAAFDGLIVAGDAVHDREDPHFVKHFSPASGTIAMLTVRTPVETALDLGCGSGVQALLASRHAGRVTGVDCNPRAIRFSRFGQRLNRVDNVSWLEGDWFDPVDDSRFELVVAALPYVISPESEILFRDSAGNGDESSRRVVSESAEHLSEGGFATVLCSWIHREGAWEEPVREWVDGLGCDAVLLHLESQEPLEYAMFWLSLTGPRDEDALARAIERWQAHYRDLGVERIARGAIVLRRRSASNWVRAFRIHDPSGPGSDQLLRIFAGVDFLTARPAAELLSELLSRAWRPVDGHRVDQTLVQHAGAYASKEAVIRQEPGIGLHASFDPRVVPVLAGCDGQRPLGHVIEQTPIPDGMDRGAFHTLCVETAKGLIGRGYLTSDRHGAVS